MNNKNRDFLLFLEDIQNAMERILMFIDDQTYHQFRDDLKTQDAVIRNFEIIGEAANQIPSTLKEKYPEVPWNQMYGLRNIISHEYFGVDLELIWNISISQLPANLKDISKIVRDEKP